MSRLFSIACALTICWVLFLPVVCHAQGETGPGAPAQRPAAPSSALGSAPAAASEDPLAKTTPTAPASNAANPILYVGIEVTKALAWPIAILLIVLLFAFHPRLNRLFGLAKVVRKIKAAGVEMEISADAVDAVRAQLRASVGELIIKARDEYDRMARIMRISDHLELALTKALPRVLENGALSDAQFRGTVHVQDIVVIEYLYQLVDYFPTRQGSGRRFPQRYGIIGRSWRLSHSLGKRNVFAEKKGEEETLIEEWGMTREEARARGRNQPACLSIVLRGVEDNDFPNGILYIDSKDINVFKDDELATKVALEMESTDEVKALRKALEQMLAPLRLAAPNLDLKRLSE